MELEKIINHEQVKELKVGDHIRSEEMTVFQKVTKIEQDSDFENCFRITFDQGNFEIISKTNFVELRKTTKGE